MGNIVLRGVSLSQPNPLPIHFGCDKIFTCFLWETWSVKWCSVELVFFFPKVPFFFFLKQKHNLKFIQAAFFLDLTINFAKGKKSTGSTTEHKRAAFVFHGLSWWLMIIFLHCFNSSKYWDWIWQIKLTKSIVKTHYNKERGSSSLQVVS